MRCRRSRTVERRCCRTTGGLCAVAFILGFDGWAAFHEQLLYWRGRIDWHFRGSSPTRMRTRMPRARRWSAANGCRCGSRTGTRFACRQLSEAGFRDGRGACQRLAALRNASGTHHAASRRERLDAFIPRLLAQAVEQDDPDLVLERVLPLVEAVARRSAYTVLLTEMGLQRRARLCAASPWIAEQIARFRCCLTSCSTPVVCTPAAGAGTGG